MKFLNFLVEWSLSNRIQVLVGSGLFVLFGLFSLQNLKMDAIPDVTNVQVQIVTSAPSLSAIEMEQFVTFPVERGVLGIPATEEVRSISRYGISLVTIVFREGTDLLTARQMVSERMVEIQKTVPQQYGTPEIGPLSTALGEVIQFTLESKTHDLETLTNTLIWNISPQLKTVPGIVEVNVFGGRIRQYEIQIDPIRMQSIGITVPDLITAIKSSNLAEGAGYLERNREHFLISVNSLLQSEEDFSKIWIKNTAGNGSVYLGDIAKIKIGSVLPKGAATRDGKGEVTGAIALMQIGENSLEVAEGVKQKLQEIQKNLPDGMKIHIFYDRSEMVLSTIRTVILNLSEGALLVIVILFLVLGNIRSGLIIAAIIPLCMLFALSIMGFRGLPANLMSLGAVDFGLLVDGAVIIIENSVRRLALLQENKGRSLTNEERKEEILDATVEVRKATIFGEAVIGIVYIPILALSGTEGMLFRPMALTVIFALLGAFIFTLTLVPVLAYYLIPKELKEEKETKVSVYLKLGYEKILGHTSTHPKILFTGSLLFLLISWSIFPFLGKEFIPTLDEGYSLLEISRLPSTGLKESVDSGLRLEKGLLSDRFPEITGIVSKTGSPNLALEPMGLEKSDMFIQLKPRKEWDRDRKEWLSDLSEFLESEFPEIAFGISQPIEMRTNEMIAGIRSDVGIKIFGSDLDVLKNLAEQVADEVRSIDGVRDLRIESLGGVNYLNITPDLKSAGRFEIRSEEIIDMIQMNSSGKFVGNLLQGSARYPIVIRWDPGQGSEFRDWNSLMIASAKGQFIPLPQVAKLEWKDGPAQISHESQERRVLVEFNVRERDLVGTVESVQDRIQKRIKLPGNYRIEYGGAYQNFMRASATLIWILPLTLVIIFSILVLAVKDLKTAFLVFLGIPLALTGGILSLFLRGLPFSISAGIGFIALSGIAVLNTLVLATFAKGLELQGYSRRESIYSSAKIRVRPVLMTALVAILGFFPMAVSQNPGAEVQQPLATVVIGGLISGCILTLILFPELYSRFHEKNFLLTMPRNRQT
jgi:cobalt-zinc-cadmium resistance protein CzcA